MGSFSLSLEKFAKQAGENADLVVKKTAIDVFSSVVKKSPVKSGRFRGNWQVGIGSINHDISSPADNASLQTQPSTFNLSKAQSALVTYKGQIIYISNSLPYAQRLENGYSKQAPAGMVRLTVVEFETYIKNNTR